MGACHGSPVCRETRVPIGPKSWSTRARVAMEVARSTVPGQIVATTEASSHIRLEIDENDMKAFRAFVSRHERGVR